MKPAVSKARRRPKLAPPSISAAAMGLIAAAGPVYARLALRMASMRFLGGQRFVESVRDFYDGKVRLIIAFRHPYGDEAQVLMYAMHRGVPREARRLGRPLARRPHCLFLHGYEVPLWSGGLVRWILPRSGSMPVYHVRQDAAGLRRIREALRDGAHPLALAPEGQVSYRSETLPRMERGALQLGFWCAEELEASHRAERVVVLPVSVHAKYREADAGSLEAVAGGLEKRLGMSPGEAPADRLDAPGRRRALGLRLRRIDLALLDLAEKYYGLRPPPATAETDAALIARRESRRAAILEEALRRAEGLLGITPEADQINRVYRIRHEGWGRIFPEIDPGTLPPLEHQLVDRKAGEAWYAMRHMETVDLAFYLDADYLEDGLRGGGSPSIGRLAETACSLADLAARLAGGNITDRPNPMDKHVVLVAEPPLELRERLPDYRADRRSALLRAEEDLARAYHLAIKEYLDEK
jgi:hypothetical protein